VVGPARPGRVLAVCGDSSDSSSLLDLAPGTCDVLVHECTYEAARAPQARRWGHSTTADVAALARALRPRLLLLTHLSSRYTVDGASPDAGQLLREVEARCPGQVARLAYDGLSVEIPPRVAPSGSGAPAIDTTV
jgi:ribonuclease Z